MSGCPRAAAACGGDPCALVTGSTLARGPGSLGRFTELLGSNKYYQYSLLISKMMVLVMCVI